MKHLPGFLAFAIMAAFLTVTGTVAFADQLTAENGPEKGWHKKNGKEWDKKKRDGYKHPDRDRKGDRKRDREFDRRDDRRHDREFDRRDDRRHDREFDRRDDRRPRDDRFDGRRGHPEGRLEGPAGHPEGNMERGPSGHMPPPPPRQ